jgi:hypothetical protein
MISSTVISQLSHTKVSTQVWIYKKSEPFSQFWLGSPQ